MYYLKPILYGIASAIVAQYSPPIVSVGLAIGWGVFLIIELSR